MKLFERPEFEQALPLRFGRLLKDGGESLIQAIEVVLQGKRTVSRGVKVGREAARLLAHPYLHRSSALHHARPQHLADDRVRDCALNPLDLPATVTREVLDARDERA